jgi:hypothetical protein
MSIQYELKHIRGIPYYLHGTTIYTFELDEQERGKPSPQCVAIGTYHTESDSIAYYPDWRERVQSHLDAFRASLQSQERNTLRQHIIKPQKPRKTPRNPRKTTVRTKNTPSK